MPILSCGVINSTAKIVLCAPVNAGKIAEITGIDRKEVDKAFAELKKEGAIVSPVRCKWQPKE